MNQKIDWNSFLLPYELAVGGFIIKLESMRKEYLLKNRHSPIEIVSGRIKTPESILEKANRLGIKQEDILENIYDIAGLRIICKYVDDVYKVFELLTSRKDLETLQVKDYIKNPKPSGYRSLHLIAIYHVETIDGQIPINVEFQIRTHAMHLWASTEHSLKYKYKRNIPDKIKERLVDAANVTLQLDEEMGKIKREIEDFGSGDDEIIPDSVEITINDLRKW